MHAWPTVLVVRIVSLALSVLLANYAVHHFALCVIMGSPAKDAGVDIL